MLTLKVLFFVLNHTAGDGMKGEPWEANPAKHPTAPKVTDTCQQALVLRATSLQKGMWKGSFQIFFLFGVFKSNVIGHFPANMLISSKIPNISFFEIPGKFSYSLKLDNSM